MRDWYPLVRARNEPDGWSAGRVQGGGMLFRGRPCVCERGRELVRVHPSGQLAHDLARLALALDDDLVSAHRERANCGTPARGTQPLVAIRRSHQAERAPDDERDKEDEDDDVRNALRLVG